MTYFFTYYIFIKKIIYNFIYNYDLLYTFYDIIIINSPNISYNYYKYIEITPEIMKSSATFILQISKINYPCLKQIF